MSIAENQTLTDWLRHHDTARPNALALVDQSGEMSYRELAQKVAQMCSGLAGLGIGKGDVVAAQLPNIREYVIAFLAVASRGGIFQTLHMPYRSLELQNLLADSGAKAVILTHASKDSRANDVISVRSELPALKSIIVAGDAPSGCVDILDLMSTGANPSDQITTTPKEPYLLLYTSGTTAAPKGVPHSYRSFLDNALLSTHEMQIGPQDRVLSLAPLTHLYGLYTLHLSLACGAASVLIPAFNPATLFDDLKAAKASHVFSAPAHFAPFVAKDMLTSDLFETTRLLCLSGAAVPQALAEAVDAKMQNGVVNQLWGMSELQAGSFGRPGDPALKRHATAGAAVPNTTLRVTNDQGDALPAGQEGALEVKGPSLFAGYLNRPEETKRAFNAEGWFLTGDLAVIDAQGFLTITGRTKEIINRGGVKFNPVEAEEVLSTLLAIQHCAIVPIPDPILGEKACLCVQLTPGTKLDLDDVQETLSNAGMAKYKWPERLVVLDELPMTPTRKVMRGKLSNIILTMRIWTK